MAPWMSRDRYILVVAEEWLLPCCFGCAIREQKTAEKSRHNVHGDCGRSNPLKTDWIWTTQHHLSRLIIGSLNEDGAERFGIYFEQHV